MLRFFLTLLLSWSISSWLLTETFFFFPSVKPIVATIEEMITIPRHDNWDLERVQKESSRLDSRISLNSGSRFLSSLFGPPEVAEAGSVLPVRGNANIVFDRGQSRFDSFRDEKVLVWWQPKDARRRSRFRTL